jgi:L-ascorbate metabolism protein UlaG (beta-lactamase superfamily)
MHRRKLRRNELRLTHLGAAGWEITDGERVMLLDPYLSRLRVTGQFGTYTTPSDFDRFGD